MLHQQARSATAWSAADIFVRQGLQFVVSIVLARLILPDQFGTFAILYFFHSIAAVFIDGGFSAALIQRQDVTREQECTVFWANVIIAAIAAALLLSFGSVIARFFEEPVLESLTPVIAASLFVSAFGSIHVTLLRKELDFSALMLTGLFATLAAAAVAIVLAFQGLGVWALAWQHAVTSLATVICLWVFCRWRPAFHLSINSARQLFSFGGYVFVSSVLDVAYTRVYALFIGKLFGPRDVGYYQRADQTQHAAAGAVTGIISRVAFPLFSKIAVDKTKLRVGLRESIKLAMLINVPLMVGLAVGAPVIVESVYGSNWLPTATVLQILAIAGIVWPMHVLNLNALLAQGMSRLFFRLEVAKKLIGIAAILIGSLFGVKGVASSFVLFSFVALFINGHYSKKLLEYGTLRQLRDVRCTFIPVLAMASAIWSIDHILKASLAIRLLSMVFAGVVIYTCVLLLTDRAAISFLRSAYPRVGSKQ